MPILSRFYDKTATTKRLVDVEETDHEAFEDYLEGVACLIQPSEASISGDIEGSFGKNWLMMCETADIIEGDRVIIDEEEYKVLGVEKLSFEGHDHMELTIRIFRS